MPDKAPSDEAVEAIAVALRDEADQASRVGQMDRLNALADRLDVIAYSLLADEREDWEGEFDRLAKAFAGAEERADKAEHRAMLVPSEREAIWAAAWQSYRDEVTWITDRAEKAEAALLEARQTLVAIERHQYFIDKTLPAEVKSLVRGGREPLQKMARAALSEAGEAGR